MNDVEDSWDYVIVGSGAGGGTLAARLAESGMRVFLLEAGSDYREQAGPRLPDDYCVPGFHAFACENPAMRWDFNVRHYSDDAQQKRDFKADPFTADVLYPRAATLGGCTAHNAMIFMLPHDSDWDHIRTLTGDRSWSAARMRRHARKLEACHHRPLWRFLRHFGIDPTGHGWDGWLQTERPPKELEAEVLGDEALLKMITLTSVEFARRLKHPLARIVQWLHSAADPNSRAWRPFEGLCYTPVSTQDRRRIGSRERLLSVREHHRDRLHIECNALATRVLFDADGAACGVEYLKGARLYRAHANPATTAGERCEVRARREVILCGGAFNTPQLLMLSGIGPAEQLRRHGIEVRVDLPGVGRNLQDRYEVAVTYRMREPWKILEGARFEPGDPMWQRWNESQAGIYASNGAALAFVRRSAPDVPDPDIFCMALPTQFDGYYPGFSANLKKYNDRLTWAVLKAHTHNGAGTVTLRSADPRDPPRIDFHYFEEGDDTQGRDLQAVVGAIQFLRELNRPLLQCGLFTEEAPGADAHTAAALADYVRNNAWGHHASCSCPIGLRANGGVVDGSFAVHGTRRLRVVDASVFPRIPGFFLVSAVYMIAEKAAETLLQEAKRERT